MPAGGGARSRRRARPWACHARYVSSWARPLALELTGQEKAPAAPRVVGLIEQLEDASLHVNDHGDLPRVVPPRQALTPPAEPDHRGRSRLVGCRPCRSDVASRPSAASPRGDCTIELDVSAGTLRSGREEEVGPLSVDGQADLNTPVTSPWGSSTRRGWPT